MELLPAIEFETTDLPDATVIWLHGLGADGNDFAPIVPQLKLPDGLGVRFIFPHAPKIPVTVNGGAVMRAWYDILEMQIDRKVDTSQLMASAAAVRKLIDHEISRGIDSRRIIIAGFSQGGAVAYQTVLSNELPLGGLLAMSTYFATSGSIEKHQANTAVPITVHHGSYDSVVPEFLGKKAADNLADAGYNVQYQTYPMDHAVCPEQIEDISAWLQSVLQK